MDRPPKIIHQRQERIAGRLESTEQLERWTGSTKWRSTGLYGTKCGFEVRPSPETNEFDEYDSQELRCVMQTSEKTQVRHSEKFKSKFLISAVRTL